MLDQLKHTERLVLEVEKSHATDPFQDYDGETKAGNSRVRRQKKAFRKALDRQSERRTVLLTHKPTCPEVTLAENLADSLERSHLTCGYLTFVPGRIGHSRCVDAAGSSLLHALHGVAKKEERAVVKVSCMPTYSKAASALRLSLRSLKPGSRDDALMAAAMLTCLEWNVEQPGSPAWYAHMHGVSAILLSSPAEELSETTRAVLHWHVFGTFQIPVALGMASPFELPRWLDVENCMQMRWPPGSARLSRLGKDLCIRLPRLVAMVRALRQGERPLSDVGDVIQLATELYECQDQEAESKLLHCISVKKTRHPADAYILPFSFHFDEYAKFSWTLIYWQTRIFAHRLCLKLKELVGAIDLPSSESLISENLRISTNIMMSVEFALATGPLGWWALRLGVVALWAATLDVEQWNKRLRVAKLRPWVLQRYADLHRGERRFDESEMDEAAEALVGGPLRGFITEIGVMPSTSSLDLG